MKKISVFLIGTLLFITSCAPDINQDEVLQKEDDPKQETSIVPSYQMSKENYKVPLPYRPSAARGVIVKQLGNRLDIDEMEEGLRRRSKTVYDPEKYLFEEGQYITEDMVFDWLGRKLTKKQLEKEKEKPGNENATDADLQQGLNPAIEEFDEEEIAENEELEEEKEEAERDKPRYLSHILEQNFLKKNEDNTAELVGVSIGLALKSVYRFQTEIGGPYYYEDISKKDMLEQGKKIAQTVLERVRKMEGLEDVPIMIALFREESQDSPVPGNFVLQTNVSGGDMSIKEWEPVDEEYVLFPSSHAKDNYPDDAQIVDSFANEIANYFPNYVGVIGEGFYVQENLKKLTLDIPIEFYGKGEVIGFTQYAYGLVKDMFPNKFDLEIKINSSDKMESLIYREAGEETPTVHIFH